LKKSETSSGRLRVEVYNADGLTLGKKVRPQFLAGIRQNRTEYGTPRANHWGGVGTDRDVNEEMSREAR